MLLTRSLTPPTTLFRFSLARSFRLERLLLTAVAEAVLKIWLKILVMLWVMLSPFLAAPMLFIWIVGKATVISVVFPATLAAACISPLLIVKDLIMTFLPLSSLAEVSAFFCSSGLEEACLPDEVNSLMLF